MNQPPKEESQVSQKFGHRLRVRICGICAEEGKVLMVRHRMGDNRVFWAPPGGGLDYGETTEEALIREFQEETGLDVRVKRFLFVHEFLKKPLHGIELFFEVERIGGELTQGIDPEMNANEQIIDLLAFLPFEEIKAQKPDTIHNIFTFCDSLDQLLAMEGLYHFIP